VGVTAPAFCGEIAAATTKAFVETLQPPILRRLEPAEGFVRLKVLLNVGVMTTAKRTATVVQTFLNFASARSLNKKAVGTGVAYLYDFPFKD